MPLVIRRLAVGVPLSLCLLVALGEPVQAKSFASCAELRKTYPRGVAQTSSAAKATGARLNATVYRANIRLDANSNKAVCERGEASAAPTTQPAPVETVGQANARKSAASYLRFSSFSRKGLIDQLLFEGYSNVDAVYGVDIQRADWNEQAKKSAASYLKYSSFSRSGLLDQLRYEGFTESEALFGVTAVGY